MEFNLEYITNYINRKISENENYIVVTFYELVMKEKLDRDQVEMFLKYSKIRLNNMNYRIYETGDTYEYNGKTETIENNVFFVAIK